MLAAVRSKGYALKGASPELRDDIEVVRAAMAQNGEAWQHAGEALRADRGAMLAAVVQNGWALRYASPELRDDIEVVRAAMAKYAYALMYASEPLPSWPRDVVLAAVRAWWGSVFLDVRLVLRASG